MSKLENRVFLWQTNSQLGSRWDNLKIVILGNFIFLKLGRNHVLIGFWDDLEAGLGINIHKNKKLAGSHDCFDRFLENHDFWALGVMKNHPQGYF